MILNHSKKYSNIIFLIRIKFRYLFQIIKQRYSKMDVLTENQLKKVNKQSLADKYSVTWQYVNAVLQGKRNANSKKAKSILQDAHNILKILETETNDLISE